MKMTRLINCTSLEWAFKCPKNWDELTHTENENIRYCQVCDNNVYFANDAGQLDKLASEGKCTAFEHSQHGTRTGIVMGKVRAPRPEERKQKE
ncbi:MAG: hypothetical protein OEZ39_00805 [Gammaproteobacteria bacterium]|nr:hypothetical protein [Gammaproteobacteria bacterium]MDH5650389.1 hypothetical protein [Gammaproteobacteria bacterium]